MNEEQIDSLKDYLGTLTNMRGEHFSIGAIHTSQEHLEEVVDHLSVFGIGTLDLSGAEHEDVVLETLVSNIKEDKASNLLVGQAPPGRVLNFLNNLGGNRIDIVLPKSGSHSLTPLPKGGLLILTFVDTEPVDLMLQSVVTTINRVS